MPIKLERNIGEQIGSLEWLAKQTVEGFITGMHKSPFHGFSVEFAEHRLYNTGDSLRHLDWKLLARTEKMFLKRYDEETNLRAFILLDHSSSMTFPQGVRAEDKNWNKFKFSIYASAALIELFRRQRDAVGLAFFDQSITLQTKAATSEAHINRLFANLEDALSEMKDHLKISTQIVESIHQMAEEMPRRSLVIIFSDMFENGAKTEEIFNALQHLRYNKHEVVVFHTTDKGKELEFEWENRPYTFIDPETLEEIKLNPAGFKSKYLERVSEWKNALALRCGQYQIDWVEVDIQAGYEEVLLAYLLKRQKMVTPGRA